MKRTNVIKKIVTIGTVSALSASMLAMPVIAGQFVTDANGKWYKNDDGTYPKSTWQWIDEDGDGKAYSYYFDENGYVVVGLTPDGFTTDATGAWLENGIAAVKDMTLEQAANAVASVAGSVLDKINQLNGVTSNSSGETASMLEEDDVQKKIDALNGITTTTTTSDTEIPLRFSQTSTGLDVGQIVTSKHTVTTTTSGVHSSSEEEEDNGPDMSQTSYDTFGPSVPAGAASQSVAPTTDATTINVLGPDGKAATFEDEE